MTVPQVLIVEDGDEYLESLTRFVKGPSYVQAHNGREALRALETARVEVGGERLGPGADIRGHFPEALVGVVGPPRT